MIEFQAQTLDLRNLSNEKQTESRPSTRPSTTFRNIGREKDAHWSNRFRKDTNDLVYDVKYDLIKGKSDLRHHQKYKNQLRNSKASRGSSFSSGKSSGISLEKYKNRIQMIKVNKIKNPEKFQIIEDKKYSTIGTQGLCKFQFEKTISGNLQYKSNRHLGFQFQTQRSINLNPVWYQPSKQFDISKGLRKSKINQSHAFSSYTDRKVFEPREQLDKFYNTAKSFRLASARTIKETCKIDGIMGRKQMRPSTGSKLSYNQYDAKMKIMNKICTYPISTIKRELKFNRQVISPERGCYR